MNINFDPYVVFATMLLAGSFFGFLYDMIRAIESPVRLSGVVAVVRDILFWLAVGFILSLILLVAADGQVRIIFLLTAILGAVFYFVGISPIIFPPMCRAAAGVHRMIERTLRGIGYVLGLPGRGARTVKRTASHVMRRLGSLLPGIGVAPEKE